MSKYTNLIRLAIFLVLASLLLTGCWKPYDPGGDVETDHTSRTFAITDVNPYPGPGYQIPDKQVGRKYDIYIYIINNGGHEKDNTYARNVKLTMIDETRSITVDVATASIDEGVGYAVIKDLSYDREARVHFHVEGDIYKNKNHEIFAKANSNSFNIGVSPPVLRTITITPANSTIQVGLTQTFTAIANYSDGTTEDVSNAASWSSSNISKASMIDNVATGVAAGTCTITATFGGKSGTTNLTIGALVLQSITVTPINLSVPVGLTRQFTATANYTNGSKTDVSNMATWSSSDESKATMAGNVATGVNEGTSTIKATFLNKSGTASLTVTAPVLQSILVTPTNASIQVGQTQTFTAMAIYSNNSSTNISNTATWSGSNESIATMASGVATGIAAGTSTITATFEGQSGTADLTVYVVPPAPDPSNRLIWEQEIVDE